MSPRNDIINNIVTNLQSVDSPDYTQSYAFVVRDGINSELTDRLQHNECAVGVYEIDEKKTRLFGLVQATLTVVIEFYYRPFVDAVMADELNRLLADLQKAMMVDYSQGGIAINTEEMSNQIDIDGIYDRIINGSITFDITYRHAMFDPTKQIN